MNNQHRQQLPELVLKRFNNQAPKVLSGHPWVFAGQVQALLSSRYDGKAATLRDPQGRFLGSGIYNSRSQIVWRRFSFTDEVFDAPYIERALGASLSKRKGMEYARLVWSEADRLPGLIVDRFGPYLVVQALTKAVDDHLSLIASSLLAFTGCGDILFRNDAPVRELEGLDRRVFTQSGKPIAAQWHVIEGMKYWMDLAQAQKTGFYLDQRFEHVRVAQYAPGKRVLDACCNQGGFALHCAKAGAASVQALDISADCIALTQKNARENGLLVDAFVGNVFDFFTESRDQRYDLIILDPPAFAKNKAALEGALRGYKELNLRALRALNPGGILVTYSCSHSVTSELFWEVIQQACCDARALVQVLAHSQQPTDHPILLTMPESGYLKGLTLQVL